MLLLLKKYIDDSEFLSNFKISRNDFTSFLKFFFSVIVYFIDFAILVRKNMECKLVKCMGL